MTNVNGTVGLFTNDCTGINVADADTGEANWVGGIVDE